MYGLMVVVEKLGVAGISIHTAGKSNTKEDLPRKFLLPQKVQHNLMDLINLCCDTAGPEEKYLTETETKNRVSTFMPTQLGRHDWSGDHVCGYVRDSAAGIVTKHKSKN